MKSEYLKNYITLKDSSKVAYQSYLVRINNLFDTIKKNPQTGHMVRLESEFHALRDLRELKVKDKQPIYKFFVERNIKDFHLLGENNSIELRLLKLTKSQFEDYQLDWRQIWQRLLDTQPEIPTIRLYNQLVDFLRIIKHLYVCDNALQVVNYFMERHSLFTDNLCLYLSLFINITKKTQKSVLTAYLDRIIELYHLNQLKASDLLIMYINATKYKQNQVQPRIHKELTKIVIYSLSTPSSEKKDSIQSKFSTQTANIIFRIIGNCNTLSVQLLQQVFQMTKLFIRPFQDSKKPLKLLCLFIMGFSKRIEVEDHFREKVAKLKAKEEKLKQKQIKSLESPLESPLEEQQSALTITSAEQTPSTLPLPKQEPEKEEQSSSSDEDQNENNESDDQDQDNKVQKMITMDLELEENIPDKMTSNQKKIQKLEALLKNQITQEIKDVVGKFISKHLEEIFYVNSKKMVSRILKECFKMFPELIPRSLEVLQKAGSIPQINEDGLISNMNHIAKYLFVKQMIEKGLFLENVLKLLGRLKEHRRITDVWDIISTFIQKIPLLDEKDMQSIAPSQKQEFQKKYNQNHDRFYQSYSDIIFECAKRLFSQSQYYDSNSINSSDKHILDLINNSYPAFKKRVLQEMEEQILENNNKFLLSIFHSGLRPSRKFEVALREMIDHGNIQSEDNLALEISVNTILSIDMDIEQIKILIRRYSRKNSYKFLKQCMVSITNYNFTYDPLSSTLDYLQKPPKIALTQEPPFQLVSAKMDHVFKYIFQLIDELQEELKQFDEILLKNMKFEDIVSQLYATKQNNFKNMKVEKRKTINQILQILKIITEYLFHQFQQYNPATKTIDFKAAPYDRQSLLSLPKFKNIVDRLLYNELFLHDPNIMHNLSNLIENQVFFMYRNHIRMEKQILRRYVKKNAREELLGESNLNYMNNIMIGKTTVVHFSILFNKYRDSVSIDGLQQQFRILVVAPGNDKSNTINKILVKKTETMAEQADRLILLLSKNIDSRFYYEKIFSLLGDFLTSGYRFTPSQVLNIINNHIPLIQSENIKIKEQSLKSFEKFLKSLHKSDLMGKVQNQLREYIKRQKFELVWMIAVLIIIREGKKDTPTDEYLGYILEFLKLLEPLVQSDIRIVRRIAIFTYSFCFRRAKQSIKTIEKVECPQLKYSRAKTILQLYETGFLRDEHIQVKDIANKEMLKKLSPYSTFRLKKRLELDIFNQIQTYAFDFVLKNPQLGLKILKQFHVDMAASVQQVISMMHNKKHDLGEIAVRNLEGCYVYAKLYKLHYDRFEHHFGQAFFKYLFNKDAKYNDFKFFKATREQVQKVLANLETYDNQTLLFIYLTDLIGAYSQHHECLTEETRLQVEKFVEKLLETMLYKGSGSIFKQLMMLVARCKYPQEVKFITSYLTKLFNSKEKVSRVSQLLFSLSEDNYKVYIQLMRFIMTQKIEVNHSYITTLINSVVTLPEKYLLTDYIIEKYSIVDLKAQIAEGRVQRLYNQRIYVASTKDFNSLLISTLKTYLEVINQPEESTLQLKNELIKATYSITTSTINTFCQFYETPEIIAVMLALLELLFQLFQSKMDLAIDYKQLEETVKNLVANKYDSIANFQNILSVIVDRTNRLPVKKQADIIKIISNRPGNFQYIGKKYYEEYILKILQYSQNSMIYKELLVSLSTLLAYVPMNHSQIESLIEKCPKGQDLLLMQAYVMSTQDIASPYLEKIMGSGSSARRNMFCKEMLQLRGKKEYLDDEERYGQWKMIKQYSNPYHYHV